MSFGKGFLTLDQLDHSEPLRPQRQPSSDNIPCMHCPQTFSSHSEMKAHWLSEHVMGNSDVKLPQTKLTKRPKDLNINQSDVLGESIDVKIEVDPREANGCSDQEESCSESSLESEDSWLGLEDSSTSDSNVPSDSDEQSETRSPVNQSEFKSELQEQSAYDESYDEQILHKCSRCGKGFPSPTSLKEHVMSVHLSMSTPEATRAIEAPDEVNSFKCEYCPSRFFSRDGLAKHLNSHTLAHQCNRCSQKFATKEQLEAHQENHANDELVCHLCSRVYKTKVMFDRHIRSHDVVHGCEHCGKTFPNSTRLRGHVQKVHLRIFHYKCKFCNKGFHEQGGLTRHERMHTGEKPFSCGICDKKFIMKLELERHQQSKHMDKPIVCQLCGKTFGYRKLLQMHIKWTHTDEKPHACSYCPYRGKSKQALDSHELTHTGGKPHVCATCNKAFRTRSQLNTHNLIHTGALPWECDVCHQRFRHKQAMKAHQQTHASS